MTKFSNIPIASQSSNPPAYSLIPITWHDGTYWKPVGEANIKMINDKLVADVTLHIPIDFSLHYLKTEVINGEIAQILLVPN